MHPGLVDLASELLGSKVITASDEFFAPKENLILAASPVFLPGKNTDVGKWMDGWETRRKRKPGHDWCVVKLGVPGIARVLEVDTSYFVGNFPERCSIDGAFSSTDPADSGWAPVLGESRLEGGRQNIFNSEHSDRITHVRLNIF